MKVNYLFNFLVAAMLMLVVTTVNAKDVTVDGTNRDAFNAAWGQVADGDTISIATTIIWDTDQFRINKGIVIRGVGDNIEIKAAPTYTASRMFNFEATGLVLENLTFSGANYKDGENDGAIGRILSGVIEIKNCIFKDNYAADRSGAVSVQGGANATFRDCKFINNQANRGGAIWFAGDATIANFYNCEFIGNNAKGERGGAFFTENAPTVNVYNSLFKGNSAGVKAEDGTMTGNGGGVFRLGNGVLNVYSSSIIENNSYGDHGGVLHAEDQPKVTFVNSTIANNRMWKDSNSMFWCPNGGEYIFINTAFVGNWGAPNAGNTTAFTLQNANAKAKIYNSIFVGNVSRDGNEIGGTGPAIDIKLNGGGIVPKLTDADAATAVLDIRNSIIGRIQIDGDNTTLTAEQIAWVTSKESTTLPPSIINEYTRTKDWKLAETSGIVWGDGEYPSGLVVTDEGSYYPIAGNSKAAKAGDPALLTAALGADATLVDQLGQTREIKDGAIAAGPVNAIAGSEKDLLLSSVIVWDGPTYDLATATVHFVADWQGGAGWDVTGMDVSAYDRVVVEFDEPIYNGYIRLTAEYGDGQGWVEAGVNNPLSLSIAIDHARPLTRIGLGSNGAPQDLVLKRAYLKKDEPIVGLLPLNGLNLLSGTAYNTETHKITYPGSWGYAGWEWAEGKDFTGYKSVTVEFDTTDLPETGDDGLPKVQLSVVYVGGNNDGDNVIEVRKGATTATVNLDPAKKDKVYRIYVKSEKPGSITLNDAYVNLDVADPVDLIITDFSWTPVNPLPGEKVTFKATVKNDSEFASPNVKHGVAFAVNGTVVTWSDTHLTSLAAGESVELTANGPGDGTWTVGKNAVYTVSAKVNDQSDITETNYDNNTAEAELVNGGKADLNITSLNWRPASPEAGNEVIFNITVENKGTIDTPNDVKHGVAFSVNGTVVSWSDTRLESIGVGKEVRLTANSGPAGVAYWTATGGSFTVKAEVNDANGEGLRPFEESDYTNNVLEETLSITGIHDITADGKVYVQNRTLHIEGYVSAPVTIYNVLGQKVVSHNAISNNESISLSAGTYIVKIQNSTYKVLVK
ncbi:MAG: T9SS type A sorting domain-containing protein [Candidatus Symbiothrix sp.]|jgi:sulfur carrier protein ThiS|nr:T9SS type A sorting domain-containing protein [Candidatus Symbiothrix sp.]